MIRFTLDKRNKIILIIFSILIALDLIFAIIFSFYNKKTNTILVDTKIEEKKDYGYPLPTEPEPTKEDKTKPQINITETNNEYIINGKYGDIIYDKSEYLYITMYNEYYENQYLYKYSLKTKKMELLTFPGIEYLKISLSSTNRQNSKNENFDGQYIILNMSESKDPGCYSHIYKINNGKLELFDKIECKYHIIENNIHYLFTSKSNKNIIVSGYGDGCGGMAYIYRKENGQYQLIKQSPSGCQADKGDYQLLGNIPKMNLLVFGEYRKAGDPGTDESDDNIYTQILTKDVDSLAEKTIINFDQNQKFNNIAFPKIEDITYTLYVTNRNHLIILNINNEEKIFDEIVDIEKNKNDSNNTYQLTYERQNGDKLLFSYEDDKFKCLNLSAKQWVNVDACGGPKKTFLGEYNGKKIFLGKKESAI